jgi:hypothetical protein
MYELGLVIRPRSYAALSRGSAQMHAAFGVSEETNQVLYWNESIINDDIWSG